MSAARLPKGLPALPPVPEGFDAWEYMGEAWKSYDFLDVPAYRSFTLISGGMSEWGSIRIANAIKGSHYIRAIKRPAKLKKPKQCGKGMQAGDKFRTCEKASGHKGKCAATHDGVMTEDVSPKHAKLTGVKAVCDVIYGPDGEGRECFVLPADAASVERMVEQAAKAMSETRDVTTYDEYARAMLKALGITSAKGRA